MKQNIYDNTNFSTKYDEMRFQKRGYNANDLIEIPNFKKMLPDVKGKRILDLGCGYGEMDLYLKKLGAEYILGIDLSEHMINIANKENKKDGVEYRVLAMEDIATITDKFDIVISSLAFHYVEDYNKLLKDIYSLLNQDGYLVFSQEHPLVTSIILSNDIKHRHTEINNKWVCLVADYNRVGKRISDWNDEAVIKYHRNFSEIINGLVNNNFKIEEILEPTPSEEAVEKVPKYIHQYDRPYFLFIRAKK